jgi:hypothetical protein
MRRSRSPSPSKSPTELEPFSTPVRDWPASANVPSVEETWLVWAWAAEAVAKRKARHRVPSRVLGAVLWGQVNKARVKREGKELIVSIIERKQASKKGGNGGNPTCGSPRPAVLDRRGPSVLVYKRVGNRIGVGTVARFAPPRRGVLVTM